MEIALFLSLLAVAIAVGGWLAIREDDADIPEHTRRFLATYDPSAAAAPPLGAADDAGRAADPPSAGAACTPKPPTPGGKPAQGPPWASGHK